MYNREFDCVPDVWSLIEWSNWLTPRKYTRRYDTLFFMCYSEQKPDTLPDRVEVTETKVIRVFFFVFFSIFLISLFFFR